MRIREFLREKYRHIAHYFGIIMIILGCVLLFPLFILFWYPGEISHIRIFLFPSLFSLIAGFALFYFNRNSQYIPLSAPDAGIIVVFAWIYASIIGSIPFVLLGGFNFWHGLFESVSGWTTTGLSVVDVTKVPLLILFWRSLMQFIGGIGFVLVMVALVSGRYSPEVFKAEGHNDDIIPHIRKSAFTIVKMYLLYFVCGSLLYIFAGMNAFDAVNHSMAAISTGGFSTKPNSINSFNSFPIELASILLMLVGQTNFTLHYLLLKGKWKEFFQSIEVKSTIYILIVSVILVFVITAIPLYVYSPNDTSSGEQNDANRFFTALRTAAFDTTSALTTTGFNASPSFKPWNTFGILVIIILMWIGGHSNSTAGGLKQLRVALIFKGIIWNFKKMLNPKTAVVRNHVTGNGKEIFINDVQLVNILIFAALYAFFFILGCLIISSYGYSLRDSFFEFASSQSTVGLSVGITNYNAPAVILITQTLGMFLGRLEFFVVFYSFSRLFTDMKTLINRSKSQYI